MERQPCRDRDEPVLDGFWALTTHARALFQNGLFGQCGELCLEGLSGVNHAENPSILGHSVLHVMGHGMVTNGPRRLL